MSLIIEQAAVLMRVQDLGRFGYRRFGLPESGPMDWWAFRAANRLVNNSPDAAGLEIGFSDSVIRIEKDALIAVCGAGYQILHNDRQLPLWMSFLVRKGDRLKLDKIPGGSWVYLALAGGVPSGEWMGSRSVYPKGGLGNMLREGDRLPLAEKPEGARWLAGRSYPESNRPSYDQEPVIRVIPGLHYQNFTADSKLAFWNQPFSVSSHSDRMGYRLSGTKLSFQGRSELVSQGMVHGEIQVPPDGQPIVMMPDHPTTGGYPWIGVICRVDLPLIAQAQPGLTSLRFKMIKVQEAQRLFSDAIYAIDEFGSAEEDQWMHL